MVARVILIIREKMTLHEEPMNLFSVVINIIDRIGHMNRSFASNTGLGFFQTLIRRLPFVYFRIFGAKKL